MAKKYYAAEKNMRKEMKKAGGMINDDMSAPALLPQGVIDKYWPKAAGYEHGYMDDLFMGVQKQMHEDANDLRRELGAKKY